MATSHATAAPTAVMAGTRTGSVPCSPTEVGAGGEGAQGGGDDQAQSDAGDGRGGLLRGEDPGQDEVFCPGGGHLAAVRGRCGLVA